MTQFVIVSTTTESADEAREIARYLVENSLAGGLSIPRTLDLRPSRFRDACQDSTGAKNLICIVNKAVEKIYSSNISQGK